MKKIRENWMEKIEEIFTFWIFFGEKTVGGH